MKTDFMTNLFDRLSLVLIGFGSMVFSVISWGETASGNKVHALILGITIIGLEIAKPLSVKAAVAAARRKLFGSALTNSSAAVGLVIASLIATVMFLAGNNANSQAELASNDPIVAENAAQIERLKGDVARIKANADAMPSSYVSAKKQELDKIAAREAEIEALTATNAGLIASGATGQVTPLNALASLVSNVFDGDVEASTVIFVLSIFIGCLIELALVAKGFSMADKDATGPGVADQETVISNDGGQTFSDRAGRTWRADRQAAADPPAPQPARAADPPAPADPGQASQPARAADPPAPQPADPPAPADPGQASQPARAADPPQPARAADPPQPARAADPPAINVQRVAFGGDIQPFVAANNLRRHLAGQRPVHVPDPTGSYNEVVQRGRSDGPESLPDFGTGQCKQCGKTFKRLTWNHTFCGEPCRVAHWESKTGAKVRKVRKDGGQ